MGKTMGQLAGPLWEYNLVKVIVVDVTDDYKLMQPPMPSDFYPVLSEVWLPRHNLTKSLHSASLVSGYLYDWHESPITQEGDWYVGVVLEELTRAFGLDGPTHSA
jgi:hypothetical protein